ncbi:MAG: hypothetical protein LBD46_00900 [Endomicrobium sp.]|jgi:UDP-N-acetylmuramyl pentapeptide phosphotransferase/UDP-N-acetylglucosamine-1-phosphate transferase|nr:hypothetical protein [Endomicrobium sp.]
MFNGIFLKMSDKPRTQAGIFAAFFGIFLFVFFIFSTAFIVIHSNHEHDTDGHNGSCAACEYILTATANVFKQFHQPSVICAFIFACLFFAPYILKHISFQQIFHTPVTLKVRLND